MLRAIHLLTVACCLQPYCLLSAACLLYAPATCLLPVACSLLPGKTTTVRH
jgi:hypothetical protein